MWIKSGGVNEREVKMVVYVVVDGKVKAKRNLLPQKKYHYKKGCWDKHSIYIE